jgi:hypothetical protein
METFLDTWKDNGLKINAEKANNTRIANKSFENISKSKKF